MNEAGTSRAGDVGVEPEPADRLDDLVDEAGMESFPASDPPGYWGRTADHVFTSDHDVDEHKRVAAGGGDG